MFIFSHRQRLFLNYLLERLKFPEDDFRMHFLDDLNKRSQDFVNLASKPLKRDGKSGDIIFPKDHEYKKYVEQDGRLVPTRFNIIDFLLLECSIRNMRQYNVLKPSKTQISATDISQFTYCAVAWSIAKTFELPKLVSTRVGASMHEKHKLLHFVRSRQSDGNEKSAERDLKHHATQVICDSGAKDLLSDLADSVAIFIGTASNNDKRKWFEGKDRRYVGQPDYVFFNFKTKKYFVVEEKFQKIPQPPRLDLPADWCNTHGYDPEAIERARQRITFYDNHLNQLRSYIYAIHDYGSLYGYLVYWRYYFTNGNAVDGGSTYSLRIEQLHARKLTGTNAADRNALTEVYVEIKKAMRDGEAKFDPALRSSTRCAGCVQSVLCGHKNGQFNSFTFPYDRRYMETKLVPFPEELRKKVIPEEEHGGVLPQQLEPA
jgi:hypothetical protein